jgi:hypothetical protein
MGVREAEPVDEAARIEENLKESRVNAIQMQAKTVDKIFGIVDENGNVPPPINPGRQCWSCDAETESDRHRWCSPECRDAYERDL